MRVVDVQFRSMRVETKFSSANVLVRGTGDDFGLEPAVRPWVAVRVG